MNDAQHFTHVNGKAITPEDHDNLQKNPVWILMQRRMDFQKQVLAQARLKKDYSRDFERFDAGQTVAIDYVLALGQDLAKQIIGES